jgi:hypothetical protein
MVLMQDIGPPPVIPPGDGGNGSGRPERPEEEPAVPPGARRWLGILALAFGTMLTALVVAVILTTTVPVQFSCVRPAAWRLVEHHVKVVAAKVCPRQP